MSRPMIKLIEELREVREPIIEQCKHFEDSKNPCGRIDGELCNATLSPAVKWRLGPCNLATHVIKKILTPLQGKRRAGQQKQKKRR